MSRLAQALAPGAVVILGASNDPNKVGGRPVAFMKRYGYRGRIYPVNPTREQVQGLKAYASLADLPEVPELAIVAQGGEEGVRLVGQCADMGVAVAVVMASGYGEVDEHGRLLQDRMLALCAPSSMRLVGPNCQGLANFKTGAVANFSTIFNEIQGRDGPLAIIGQSGAATQSVYALAHSRRIGVRYVHATGNEADVTVADLLLETVDDVDIRAVILYVESLGEPDLLAQAMKKANERNLPVIAIKAGRTAEGQRTARQHTGAEPVKDSVVDAFCLAHNITRAIDPYDAVSMAALFLGAPRPSGSRFVALSSSGASCVMAADTAGEQHLDLLTFDSEVEARLAMVMPPFSGKTNPVDLTGALLSNRNLFSDVLDVLSDIEDLHLLMVSLPIAGSGYDLPRYAAKLADISSRKGLTVAFASYQKSVRDCFEQAGLVVFDREREAIRALGAYARLTENTHRVLALPRTD